MLPILLPTSVYVSNTIFVQGSSPSISVQQKCGVNTKSIIIASATKFYFKTYAIIRFFFISSSTLLLLWSTLLPRNFQLHYSSPPSSILIHCSPLIKYVIYSYMQRGNMFYFQVNPISIVVNTVTSLLVTGSTVTGLTNRGFYISIFLMRPPSTIYHELLRNVLW